MILYGSLLLGVLFVTLGKLNRVFYKEDFSWKLFWRLNGISIAMNVVAGLALVINQKELITLLLKVVPQWAFVTGGLFSFFLGVAGVTLVQYLVEIGDPRQRTKIGLNNK